MKQIQVAPGSNVELSVRVQNKGASSGSRDVVLKRDGTTIDTRTVDVPNGETQTVELVDDGLSSLDVGTEVTYTVDTPNVDVQATAKIIDTLVVDADTTTNGNDVFSIDFTTGNALTIQEGSQIKFDSELLSGSDVLYVDDDLTAVPIDNAIKTISFHTNKQLEMPSGEQIVFKQ